MYSTCWCCCWICHASDTEGAARASCCANLICCMTILRHRWQALQASTWLHSTPVLLFCSMQRCINSSQYGSCSTDFVYGTATVNERETRSNNTIRRSAYVTSMCIHAAHKIARWLFCRDLCLHCSTSLMQLLCCCCASWPVTIQQYHVSFAESLSQYNLPLLTNSTLITQNMTTPHLVSVFLTSWQKPPTVLWMPWYHRHLLLWTARRKGPEKCSVQQYLSSHH